MHGIKNDGLPASQGEFGSRATQTETQMPGKSIPQDPSVLRSSPLEGDQDKACPVTQIVIFGAELKPHGLASRRCTASGQQELCRGVLKLLSPTSRFSSLGSASRVLAHAARAVEPALCPRPQSCHIPA